MIEMSPFYFYRKSKHINLQVVYVDGAHETNAELCGYERELEKVYLNWSYVKEMH
jgi:hypothetical protein